MEAREDADGPFTLFTEASQFAHDIASSAIDDKCQRSPPAGIRLGAHERQQGLQAFKIGGGVRRGDIDDLAIVQCTGFGELLHRFLELFGRYMAVPNGDGQPVMMGDANVDGHADAEY